MLKKEDHVDTHVAGIEPSASVKLLSMQAGEEPAGVAYDLLDRPHLSSAVAFAQTVTERVAREDWFAYAGVEKVVKENFATLKFEIADLEVE